MTIVRGTGWIKDSISPKDYTQEHPAVVPVTERLNLIDTAGVNLPQAVDLRAGFSPVIDQGQTNGCSGCASVALYEYSSWLVSKKLVKSSGMFVYKAARNLIHVVGDVGAYLRAGMKALALVGACPEEFWPYNPLYVNVEPSAFCYMVAKNFEALKYYRLDITPKTTEALLQAIKAHLAAKVPVAFGVYLPHSAGQMALRGMIPYPTPWSPPVWGHAMVAVGYDDRVIQRAEPSYGFWPRIRGALLVRNSWGPGWGQQGYGWLPYEYVLNRLTGDWWALVSSTWVDLDVFNRAAVVPPSSAVP